MGNGEHDEEFDGDEEIEPDDSEEHPYSGDGTHGTEEGEEDEAEEEEES